MVRWCRHWIGLVAGVGLLLRVAMPCEAAGRDLVKARLVADATAVQPGESFRLGVLFEMREGWHIYWKHPGDAGLPTEIGFRLPEGFQAGELRWPVPVTFRQPGDIVGYGYEGSVLLWTTASAPRALKTGSAVKLAANASWLSCKDQCVRGRAKLALELPVRAAASPANAKLFDRWARRLPLDVRESPLKAARTSRGAGDGAWTLTLAWTRPPAKVEWLPVPPQNLGVEGVSVRTTGRETRVAFRIVVHEGKAPNRIGSLVVYDREGHRRGVRVPVPLDGAGQ